MKARIPILSAVIALAFASGAAAADLRPAYKAPPPVPMYNWSGFYLGGFVGGGWTKSVTTNDPVVAGSNGVLPVGFPYDCPAPGAPFFGAGCAATYGLKSTVIAGGTIGYNWQAAGSPYVFGIEGEIGSMRLSGAGVDNFTAGLPCSTTGPFLLPPSQCNTFFNTKIGDWYGVASGRLGYAWDRVLVYAKVGAAFTRVEVSTVDNCSVAPCGAGLLNATGTKNVTGVAAGGGIEYALAGNWSIKGEYLYVGVDQTVQACGPQTNAAVPASFGATFCSSTEVHGVHTAKFGLNYRFGYGPAI